MIYFIRKDPERLCTDPVEWRDITKIDGPIERHIEQLWDEVKKLRDEIKRLKEKKQGW